VGVTAVLGEVVDFVVVVAADGFDAVTPAKRCCFSQLI